jgi:solute:Na+ symporter, SSS family
MEMPEGAGQLFDVANANGKFSLGSFSLSPDTLVMAEPTFWMVLLYGLFINLQNFGVDQSFVQRYITAKSDRDATFSVWLGAILFPIISVLFFFIGTGLFSLYHSDPGLMNEVKSQVAETQLVQAGEAATEAAITARVAELSDSDIGDKVLPHFIVRKLPMGIAGLLIAAIFAAAMSSIDTSLNSSATLVLCDIYQRYLRPDVGERESMKVLYVSTFLFGIAGTFTALAMIRVRSALDAWWNLQGILTGGMLGLFLLGLIAKRARNPQAMIAVAIGILVILWLSLSTTGIWPESLSGWSNPLHSSMTIVLGTSSIVLVGALAGLFASEKQSTN